MTRLKTHSYGARGGFSLGGTLATLALAAAVAAIAGPKIAESVKRRLAEAEVKAHRVADSAETFLNQLPDADSLWRNLFPEGSSAFRAGTPAPDLDYPLIVTPPQTVFELIREPYNRPFGRPLYDPYWRSFRDYPWERFQPVVREPERSMRRRRRRPPPGHGGKWQASRLG